MFNLFWVVCPILNFQGCKVHVKNGIISHPTVYFLGIKNPIGHEDSIDIECSLCVTHKNCNKKDKKNTLKTHKKYVDMFTLKVQ